MCPSWLWTPLLLSSPAEGMCTGCSVPGNFLNEGSRLSQDSVCFCFCLSRVSSQGA